VRFPAYFGPLTPAVRVCVRGALQLLDLVGLPLCKFVDELQDRLLRGNANLYKLHNENNFSAGRKKRISLAGSKGLQLWPTGSKFRNRDGAKVFDLSRMHSGTDA